MALYNGNEEYQFGLVRGREAARQGSAFPGYPQRKSDAFKDGFDDGWRLERDGM